MIEPTLWHYLLVLLPFVLIPTIKRATWRIFGYGIIFQSGVMMFMQDWQGHEAYLVYVKHEWVNFHWGVGLFITIAAVILAAHTNRALMSRTKDALVYCLNEGWKRKHGDKSK